MTLIGVSSWDSESMFSVELEFLFDDTKWFLGDFTFYCPVEYIIGILVMSSGSLLAGIIFSTLGNGAS